MRDRTGQIWLLKGHPDSILLITGPPRESDLYDVFGHPCLNLLTGEFDMWYENKVFRDWDTHVDFERIA